MQYANLEKVIYLSIYLYYIHFIVIVYFNFIITYTNMYIIFSLCTGCTMYNINCTYICRRYAIILNYTLILYI